MAHEDIKYEQACILYNLGELPNPFPLALPPSPANPGSQQVTRQWAHGKKPLDADPFATFPIALPAPLFWAMGSHPAGEKLRWAGCHMVLLLCALARSGDLSSLTGQL